MNGAARMGTQVSLPLTDQAAWLWCEALTPRGLPKWAPGLTLWTQAPLPAECVGCPPCWRAEALGPAWWTQRHSLGQHYHSTVEFPVVTGWSYTVPASAVATRHAGLLSTGSVASVREEPNSSFYLILINFNL